jgi:hypothetical protein
VESRRLLRGARRGSGPAVVAPLPDVVEPAPAIEPGSAGR